MASGDTLVIFTPLQNEPPIGNYAKFDTRNAHPVLDFRDASVNELAVFSGVLPRHYAGGGITLALHYAMSTATSGDVDWAAAFERIGDQQQDLDVNGFASVQAVNDTTVPGTSGLVDIVEIAFTDGAQIDNLAVGEGFRVRIARGATSDTAVGDAELVFVELRET